MVQIHSLHFHYVEYIQTGILINYLANHFMVYPIALSIQYHQLQLKCNALHQFTLFFGKIQ